MDNCVHSEFVFTWMQVLHKALQEEHRRRGVPHAKVGEAQGRRSDLIFIWKTGQQ